MYIYWSIIGWPSGRAAELPSLICLSDEHVEEFVQYANLYQRISLKKIV